MTIRYTITISAGADGIHCLPSLLANRRTIMMDHQISSLGVA
jgi:hypothetical protein